MDIHDENNEVRAVFNQLETPDLLDYDPSQTIDLGDNKKCLKIHVFIESAILGQFIGADHTSNDKKPLKTIVFIMKCSQEDGFSTSSYDLLLQLSSQK